MIVPEQKIYREYRTVFINNEYVSGCQYMENMELKTDSYIPDNIIEFAKEIAQNDMFANQFEFVIDIGIIQEAYSERLCLI